MSGIGLTQRQGDVLAFLKAEARAGRPAPSFDEIAAHLGLRSKASVHRIVTALEERGHLVRMPFRARAVGLAVDPAAHTASAVSPGPGLRIPRPVADRLRTYCERRRVAARDVIADALSDYMARHP